ncbi:FAS1-like dehydratase domain-containing protein [Oceanobacillus rekensis]|uniref:FAS1-like dehydratase domain-containing protein n=1 Tax=Oceanobacillus rekensis TaxID=937927 RepID=UPI000B433DAE|nr:MaoC family dehydratase N-terminal domain-containing protein [Oceanobacillus rekensis]
MIQEGFVTEAVAIKVTRDDIRLYSEAIGEENPIFHNPEAARNAGYDDLVLPVTYPTLFWQRIDIPWLSNQSPVVQTEQEFYYEEPLVANQVYHCQIAVLKVRQKGNKLFSKHELRINQDNKSVATSNTTLMLELG